MHGLHEVLGVDDGPDLAVVVGRPVGLGDLGPALAGVHPVVVVLAVAAGKAGLPLLPPGAAKVELVGEVAGRGEVKVQVVLGVGLVLNQEILEVALEKIITI